MTGQEIAEAVEKIIREIPKKDYDLYGSINWEDLHCGEVLELGTKVLWSAGNSNIIGHNYTGVKIIIEKADPFNNKFHNYIYQQLYGKYKINAQIITEW